MQELRTVTNCTARSLGQVISSKAGLFCDTVEDFAQQFSAVQKQTEAIKHILPRCESNKPPAASGGVELAVGEGHSPLLRRQQPGTPAILRHDPETGDPEMEEIALRETNICAPTPRGRAGGLYPGSSPERRPSSSDSGLGYTFASRSSLRALWPRGNQAYKLSYRRSNIIKREVLQLSPPPRDQDRGGSAALCSPILLWNAVHSTLSLLPPHGCPIVGTSPVPLIPLARRLGAWLSLPNLSRWLIRTVRLGYAIQFARRPPKYKGILFTYVRSHTDASVLRAEIVVLLAKNAIKPVPPAEMKSGFYSPYFIIPKKNGGLRPILDLQDWFAAIVLKDAYFHVSILPRHRSFLQFAFEGQAYQYKVLRDGHGTVPVVRPCVPSGGGALRPGLEARDCQHGYLQHGLGCCMQRAIAVAHQLPRVTGSVSRTSSVSAGPAVEACASLDRQHGDSCLHQSPGWFTLLLHVASCPPSPPLDSDVAQIAMYRSYSRVAEPCSQHTLTTAHSPWRMETPSPGGSAHLESIWGSPESSLCQLFYSLTEAPIGMDALAHSWPRGLIKYAFPPVSLLAQTLCKIREDKEKILLVTPFWPTRICFAELMLEDSPEEGPSFSGVGHHLAPASRSVEPSHVASGWDTVGLSGLPQAMEKLERRLSPSTLKVYVAAIVAYHDTVDGFHLGRHHLLIRFLRGARRLNPPRPHLIPSWDLSMVLTGLRRDPFEPLESVEIKYLSNKGVIGC
ncbi:Gag-Pol polyprotein [Labeo rohita]|uniref:Gag-Pol polyprotein n=1 Tax=Labeo rohita TaxID=84645 RepID=A0ABQ8MW24_LABRO|nr:Gag-Pol polyprotein [Labeo rohita]